MISRLKGNVDGIFLNNLILDVNGVGYDVQCANRFLSCYKLGDSIVLEIVTIIREDAFVLYGFPTIADKEWFEILLSVQGVGAKVALAIQSLLSIDELYNAILSKDPKAFSKVSGIGPKLANRILLELKDKVSKLDNCSTTIIDSSSKDTELTNNQIVNDTISVIVNLGYNKSDAFKTVNKVVKEFEGDISISAILPIILKYLQK